MGSWAEMAEQGAARKHGTGGAHECVIAHHDGGLLTIGLLKLIEAVFFFLVGIGAIHFIHHDLGDSALRLAQRLRMDPDGRLMSYVFDNIDILTSLRLKQIGLATMFYAVLRVTEGVGLVLEKTWAEYLTICATVSFLPWELYELVRHLDWIRVSLLGANLLVLAYLVWWLAKHRRKRRHRQIRAARAARAAFPVTQNPPEHRP
ncbi:MAG: DUF2127 domain-containing protein [Acidobacteriaceae bacterium]|nr:DUF2127 domain-containing protein [Acidobacteriaceae bacterium]